MTVKQTDTTIIIHEPQPEMTKCVQCGERITKHTALWVQVVRMTPYVPGHTSTWTFSDNSPWGHMQTTWSAAQQAMLNAFVGYSTTFPEATHLIDTYTGYACCREHAEQAAKAKAGTE